MRPLNYLIRLTLLSLGFGFISVSSFAQPIDTLSNTSSTGRYISIGPSLSSYKGDLSNYEKFTSGFEVSLIQNKGKKIQSIFNFAAGMVVAQTSNDVYSGFNYTPLYFVQTRYMAVNYSLNYYIVNTQHFKSYLGVGFGVFQFKPFDQYKNEIHSISNQTRLDTEEYELTKTMFPVQAGFIYTLKNDIGAQFNFKWMNTGTDYLDNMSRLANPNDNDNILLINIGLVIPLGDPSSTTKSTSSKPANS